MGIDSDGLSFKIGTIPVVVRPAFLILPIVGSLAGSLREGIAWTVIVFISVLIHELGHALAVRAFSAAPSIELHAMGGVTRYTLPNGTAGKSFWISLAGPSAGLLLGGIVFAFSRANFTFAEDPFVQFIIVQALWANIAWSIVNLAPILPWDGGHILDSGLHVITGRARPRVVGIISIVLSGVVILIALRVKMMLLGYFGVMGIMAGYARFQSAHAPGLGDAAWKLIMSGKVAEGEAVARKALSLSTDTRARGSLIEMIAWARLMQNDLPGARAHLAALQGFTPSVELRARLAAAENKADDVVALLEPLAREGTINDTAVPLLISAVQTSGSNERVVQVCADLLKRGEQTPKGIQHQVHEAMARIFAQGHYELSLSLCVLAFEKLRTGVHAFNVACSLSKLGRLDEALSWLHRAVDSGFHEVNQLRTDVDLAPVRELSGFQAIVTRAEQLSAAKPAATPG